MHIKLTLVAAEKKKDRMNGGGERFPDAQGCVERRGPRGRKSGIGWIKAVVSLMKCSLARAHRGRVYYYIQGRGSHCQTAAARSSAPYTQLY